MGGDFFNDIPVNADAYIMRWILHDWNDGECIHILANVKRAAGLGARVVAIDSVIPEGPEPDMGKWMDLNMMVNISGRERTAAEFKSLFERAGLEVDDIVQTASPLGLVVSKPLS